MDNNMSAIVSSIMIVFGFLNGLVIATLVEQSNSTKVHTMLVKAVERKFELEQRVDELEKRVENEVMDKMEILLKMNRIVRQHLVGEEETESTASSETAGDSTD